MKNSNITYCREKSSSCKFLTLLSFAVCFALLLLCSIVFLPIGAGASSIEMTSINNSLSGASGEIYLSSSGSDSNDGTTPSTSVATVNKAIELASSNKIVYVMDTITISSSVSAPTNRTTFARYSSNTSNVMFVLSGDNTTIENFIIDGANVTTSARAVSISSTGTITINNCEILNNTAGGIIADGCNGLKLNINSSLFNENSALVGGAICMNNTSGFSAELILNDVDFTNNSATGSYTYADTFKLSGKLSGGGAIFSSESLDITNCDFVGNSAKGNGGAIYSNGATYFNLTTDGTETHYYNENFGQNNGGFLYLRNCPNGIDINLNNVKISQNVISSSSSGSGSAIAIINSINFNFAITKSEISKNFSDTTNSCGAIYIFWSKGGELVIKDSELTENTAERGGAICFWGNSNIVNISNCKFLNNESDVGGAILVFNGKNENSKINLLNCEFRSNLAKGSFEFYDDVYKLNGELSGGGAIFSSESLEIINCDFVGNSAVGNGGAIFSKGAENVTIIADGNQMNGNKVTDTSSVGGWLYVDGYVTDGDTQIKVTNLVMSINNSQINNVKDENGEYQFNGGGIYISNCVYGAQISIIGCEITGNSLKESTSTTTTSGGAIYLKSSHYCNIKIVESLISYNEAKSYAGFIRIDACSWGKVIILNNTFLSNKGVGGVLFINDCSKGEIFIKECNFNSNYGTTRINSQYNSGVISIVNLMSDSEINFINCNFVDNYSANIGGAININSLQTINIDGCSFIGNQALVGGALFINLKKSANSTGNNLNITNSNFIGNSATGSSSIGSEDDPYDTSGTISGGGAIFTTQSLNIDSCNFENNSAVGDGGAIWCCFNSDIVNYEIYSSSFINNSTQGKSGAIHTCRVMNIYDCYFEGNHAVGNGGVMGISSSNFYNCIFTKNYSESNGGVFYQYAYDLKLYNCKLYDNFAKGDGGAIATRWLTLLYNTDLYNNYCGGNGGGIFIDNYENDTRTYRIALYDDNLIKDNFGGVTFDGESYQGGSSDDLYINNYQENRKIYAFLGESSKGEFNITFNEENCAEYLNGNVPVFVFSNDVNKKSGYLDILNCVNEGYEFELRDDGIYLKKVSGLSQNEIPYTASDYIGAFDGKEHTIDIKTYLPDGVNASITYSLEENGTYTKTAPSYKFETLGDDGSQSQVVVYFKINADGYNEVSDSRIIKIKPFINYTIEKPVFNLPYGNYPNGMDITRYLVSGRVLDQNGNVVDGIYTSDASNSNPKFDFSRNRIAVYFRPTNSNYNGMGIGCDFYTEYGELWFEDGNFYTDEACTQNPIPKSEGLDVIINHMSQNGVIYFKTPYEITSNLSIESDKIITLKRYVSDGVVSDCSIFTINAGTLTIGNYGMSGKIVVDGSGGSNASNPLIINNSGGTLNIFGNVVLQNGISKASVVTIKGGAIYNAGTAVLDFNEISNCQTLNSTSASGGGAIYNEGSLTMKNLSIVNCIAFGGGAICSSGASAYVDIFNCVFDKNYSQYSSTINPKGFAVCILGGGLSANALTISNSSLITTSGTVLSATSEDFNNSQRIGGGRYIASGAEADIINSTFQSCVANIGGAIYCDGTLALNSVHFLSCSTFSGDGVAVGLGAESSCEILDCKVDGAKIVEVQQSSDDRVVNGVFQADASSSLVVGSSNADGSSSAGGVNTDENLSISVNAGGYQNNSFYVVLAIALGLALVGGVVAVLVVRKKKNLK